jgi:SPP1 family predicted phage head-tail adaptor
MAGGPLYNRSKRNGGGKSIGSLRHRVTIQSRDGSTRDTHGQEVPTWVDDATVWASVEPVNGKELFASQHNQGQATHKVVIRHRASVTTKNRLVWVTSQPAGMVLNIIACPPEVGCGNSIALMCVHEESAT